MGEVAPPTGPAPGALNIPLRGRTGALGTRAQLHLTDHFATMLSFRVPLATIADPQQQQLSPLKGLSLADKENTVSGRGAGVGGRAAGSCGWLGARAGF